MINKTMKKGQSLKGCLFYFGILFSNSLIQTSAELSDGARQSPLGESEPPEATLGPFGTADLLNWLV